jgi:hypothetical protein
MTKARTANSTYPKGGVSCSKDSFVVKQTLVFQIKFCGKSPTNGKPETVVCYVAKKYRKTKRNKLIEK